MKIEPRLIFGVRTGEAVSFTITAGEQLPERPPALWIKTSEQDIEIPCINNAWVTTLGAGDHIAYMPAPGDSWFKGPLTFTLGAPATIVGYTDPEQDLPTWTAMTGVVDVAGDSKNPWPPPLAGSTVTPLVDPGWLGSTLKTMATQIAIMRSAPPPQGPPAGPAERRRYR